MCMHFIELSIIIIVYEHFLFIGILIRIEGDVRASFVFCAMNLADLSLFYEI